MTSAARTPKSSGKAAVRTPKPSGKAAGTAAEAVDNVARRMRDLSAGHDREHGLNGGGCRWVHRPACPSNREPPFVPSESPFTGYLTPPWTLVPK
ncbi:MAG: hypothetical protein QOH66_382 [Actinomycetota bacterium]|jgi:hypothetical protein|nr:hypothetical protein [Actinomycetota bacterium]